MTDTFYILIRLVVMWAYTFINTQTGHLDICNSLHVKFPSIKRCDYLLPSLIFILKLTFNIKDLLNAITQLIQNTS